MLSRYNIKILKIIRKFIFLFLTRTILQKKSKTLIRISCLKFRCTNAEKVINQQTSERINKFLLDLTKVYIFDMINLAYFIYFILQFIFQTNKQLFAPQQFYINGVLLFSLKLKDLNNSTLFFFHVNVKFIEQLLLLSR